MGVKFGLLTIREQHRFSLFENRVERNFFKPKNGNIRKRNLYSE
jgi:hypothetical protein